MKNLTEPEKKVLQALIQGLPLVERPFAKISEELKLPEEEVLSIVQSLLERKIIRRLGATLRHNLTGYAGNAMVAWIVPEDRIEEVGLILAQKPFISHCYVRKTYPDWPYNFYTMCHAKSREKLLEHIEELSKELNLRDYEVLFTLREVRRKHAQYRME
jgi:DNA-binding Lrp family transcriptional regulator